MSAEDRIPHETGTLKRYQVKRLIEWHMKCLDPFTLVVSSRIHSRHGMPDGHWDLAIVGPRLVMLRHSL
jgi:hypothetical protein